MLKSLPKNFDFIFLTVLSLAGVGLVLLVTSRYGAGVAGDSIHYLSVAENLLKGKGFVDYTDAPLIWFPPLLPLVLAGLAGLFRAEVLATATVFHALLWGLDVFLSGWILRRFFRDQPVYFYLATLIVFISPSSLALHASVLSDPLFLTLTLLFLLVGENYLEKPGWRPFLALLVLASLASLQRFSGFAQIVAGGLLILYARGRKILTGFPLAALFGGLSFLPVGLWIYLHNYLPYGTWWGTTNSAGADVWLNFLQSLRKMLYWFVPYRPLSPDGLVEPLVVLGLLLVGLLAINRLKNWLEWGREFLRPLWVSSLLFGAVYYSSTILNLQTGDHKALFSDRYFIILLVPVLALLFLTFDRLLRPHLRFSPRQVEAALVVFCLLWSVYPLSKIVKYISQSLAEGESGYNQYNTRAFHESEILAKTRDLLAHEPESRLYSNISPIIWLMTRHTMTLPPAQDTPRTKDQIKTEFAGWPGDKPGYYVWFEPDPFELFMPLKDLALVADLEPVEQAADGQIFRVTPRRNP